MLKAWISEDATQSSQELSRRIQETFQVTIPANMIQKHLGAFIYSITRLDTRRKINNDERTINLRKEYGQIFHELPTMFEDKSIIYVGHSRIRVATRGGLQKDVQLREYSLCVAMTNYSIIHYEAEKDPISPQRLADFLLQTIAIQSESQIISGVFIMDDSGLTGGELESLTEAVQNKEYTVICIPPDSPILDPSERFFEGYRTILDEAKVNSDSELEAAITTGEIFRCVCESQRYIDEMKGYLTKCLAGNAIEIITNLETIYAEACEGEDFM